MSTGSRSSSLSPDDRPTDRTKANVMRSPDMSPFLVRCWKRFHQIISTERPEHWSFCWRMNGARWVFFRYDAPMLNPLRGRSASSNRWIESRMETLWDPSARATYLALQVSFPILWCFPLRPLLTFREGAPKTTNTTQINRWGTNTLPTLA